MGASRDFEVSPARQSQLLGSAELLSCDFHLVPSALVFDSGALYRIEDALYSYTIEYSFQEYRSIVCQSSVSEIYSAQESSEGRSPPSLG